MNRYLIHTPRVLPEFYPGKRFVNLQRMGGEAYTLYARHEYQEGRWYLLPDGADRPYIIDSEEHLRLYYEPL